MTRTRPLLLAALAATFLALAVPPAQAAPSRGGGAVRHGGHYGNHGGHGYHYRGPGVHWGWGLGLALGVPWALGYYDPWYWGPRYYYNGPYYARGPLPACDLDEDCWRERRAREEPPVPTTQVPSSAAIGPAAAPAPAEGAPTQRPLHLNYCEASRAYYPAVTSCASGWRMTAPRYD
jgi:hypothetical protein